MTGRIPETLEDAIDLVEAELPETTRLQIRSGEIKTHVSMHSGLGMSIRNDLCLWEETAPLVQHFRTRFGLGHADDISGIILAGVFAKIRGRVFDPMPQVRSFTAHWKHEGLDALDQKPIGRPDHQREPAPRNWFAWLGLRQGD